MTFAQSALRKTISIAAAIALVLPNPALAGSFARKAPGMMSTVAPITATTPKIAAIPKIEGVQGLGLIPLSGKEIAPASGIQAAAMQMTAVSPVEAAVQRLEAAGVNLQSSGMSPMEAQQMLAAAAHLPEGQAKQNIVAMAKMMSAPGAGFTAPDGGAGKVFDNAGSAASAAPVASESFFWKLVPNFLRRKAAAEPARAAKPAAQFEVPVAKLRWTPSQDALPETTREIPPAEVNPNRPIVGQDNALKSLFYGLKMPGLHYNVFVSGPEGSGRETAAKALAKGIAAHQPTPNDVVQVTNFMQKDNPLLLQLPAGKGPEFAAAVEKFIKLYQGNIANALNQKEAVAGRKQIVSLVDEAIEQSRAEFDAAVDQVRLPGDKFGIRINSDEDFGLTVPDDGRMVTVTSDEQLNHLIESGVFTRAEWEQAVKSLRSAVKPYLEKYDALMAMQNDLKEKANEQIAAINGQMAQSLVQQLARGVIATVGKNTHDTPAHKEYEKKAQKAEDDFQAELTKSVRLAGKYTIVFQIVGNRVGLALARIGEDGRLVALSQEEMQSLFASGAITQEAVQAAAKPWAEKFVALMQANQEAHKAVHKNDPPETPEEREAMQYAQLMLSHAAANWQLFTPAEENQKKPDPEEIYQANVLASNAPGSGAPVIEVADYSFDGIFGSADGNKKLMMLPNGAAVRIDGPGGPSLKSGSLQRAQGGYWIANVMDLLKSPGVWPSLMAAVRTGQIEIVEDGLQGLATMRGARYRAPGRTKVVLIGSPMIRMMLQQYDQDFALNFPQMATSEFEPSLPISQQSIEGYLEFFGNVVRSSAGAIAHHTKDAMAALLEFASKLSGSNEKLTAQFGVTYSLMREATMMAHLQDRKEVTRADIDSALAARALSGGVYVRHHQELYNKGVFKIMTEGEEVGTMNGLAVLGDDRGVAMRMTVDAVARGAGDPILVSLDRNAGPDVTGSSFNKALGVEESIIRTIFGYNKTLPVSFRLSFEQNYGGIDGDSATSTIVYALISAISGVPIKQQYANTGSADQRYWVQPIGGVNAKIAGFYDIAVSRGLTGKQGVIIPKTNEAELNLRPDIVAAIAAGHFHVYSVSRIEDAMEILTGESWETIKAKALVNLEKMAKQSGK